MEEFSYNLRPNGKKPKNIHDSSLETSIMCFANQYGLTKEDVVHRKAIFNYVQIDIANYSEKALHSRISESECWEKISRATYRINELGEETIKMDYSVLDEYIKIYPIVKFTIPFREFDSISVVSYPDKSPYKLYYNDKEVSSLYMYHILEEEGVRLKLKGRSRPREVLCWILEQDYDWSILNYDEIIKCKQKNENR